jgi:alpha-galactosidase
VMSACVDFRDVPGELLTLSGAWARERRMDWRPLAQGTQGVASARGASSAQSSPFLLLAEHGATEDFGEVYAFTLAYSGNFTADVTVDQFGGARSMIGLNDAYFAWQLFPGETFTTPEAVLVYAANGLSGMSRAWHTLCHNHVARGQYANAQRPILLNNWEATYFDFTEEKLLALATKAAQIGVELFVLDDGWFGRRDSDLLSLGDWVEDPRKLPHGLAGLSERVRALGLRFGLWMEPEMVSPNSDLYRAHPDWCLHAPGMPRLTGRNQLVLDMGRAEVQEYVYQAVAGALTRSQADYIKWDMNRNFSPAATPTLPPARQRETAHRYMLGLYAVLERLTAAFPQVLFESCASGGGRFDLGMLYYMPQTWCSDNTDAHDRCFIQYGTSLLFPPSAMGAHISAVPNHQTGRVTTLETRSAVAMGGTYGFELDLTQMDEAELARMQALLTRVKSVRDTLLYGHYYRLWNPYIGYGAAWMSISPCGQQAVVTAVRFRSAANGGPEVLRLRGLDEAARYTVRETGEVLGGDELMNLGLPLQFAAGDDTAYTIILDRM